MLVKTEQSFEKNLTENTFCYEPTFTGEQSSANLNLMTCEEKDKMKTLNQKYKDKFGFPFVICARLNKKEAILKGLELRCYNSLKVSMTSVVEHSEIQLTEYLL